MDDTVIRLLDDAHKQVQSLRAENHSLRIQLHQAGLRESAYITTIREQVDLIRLLEGGVPNVA